MINVRKLATFINDNFKDDTIMKIRTLPIITEHCPAVTMIAHGSNIWSSTASLLLLCFQRAYLVDYASFPTNT